VPERRRIRINSLQEKDMKHLNRSVRNLALASVLGGLAAAPALAAPARNASAPSFKVYDRNADGTVSQAEFLVQGGHEEAFHEGDANRDNRLSSDEFIKANAYNDRLKADKGIDDAWISAKVKALLVRDEAVKGLDVKVQTHEGMVLLSGRVDDAGQIAQAERIARGVEGVKMVSNDLRIKR
jgi:hyperosmotically inducible protein